MNEYAPAKTVENPSLHLVQKNAWIFILGHYLFLKARSFPQATLSENCLLLRTDNVPVNYVSIFSQQIEAIVYFYQHQQRLLKG